MLFPKNLSPKRTKHKPPHYRLERTKIQNRRFWRTTGGNSKHRRFLEDWHKTNVYGAAIQGTVTSKASLLYAPLVRFLRTFLQIPALNGMAD